MSKKNKEDDYVILFRGAKLSKNQAKSVGIGIFFGILGILILITTSVARTKIMAYILIAVFSIIGYCLGVKLFERKRKD